MGKTILVIDDDQTILTITEMLLRKQPYPVVTAKSGLEGLAWLAQNDVGLILLDLVMPFMDGFEVLQKIKEDPRTKEIPVVILTGESEVGMVKRAREMGAKDYLLKPPNQQVLIEKAKQFLD